MTTDRDLNESRREQVEHYCAATRYSIFKDENDAEGLMFNSVE